MPKPIVFISHINEEKDVALAFKKLVEGSFLGLLDIFVSSDDTSLKMGTKWLEEITGALKQCAVEVVVASPISVKRPWINFEAGAGWIRDIPVIPLCHSGMKPAQLPVPLNLLTGAVATEVSALKLVMPVLAKALGSDLPKMDYDSFIEEVRNFEQQYTFWDECNQVFATIHKLNADLIAALRQGKNVLIDLTDLQIAALDVVLPFLRRHELLDFSRVGNTKITTSGMFYECRLIPQSKLSSVLADSRLKIS